MLSKSVRKKRLGTKWTHSYVGLNTQRGSNKDPKAI